MSLARLASAAAARSHREDHGSRINQTPPWHPAEPRPESPREPTIPQCQPRIGGDEIGVASGHSCLNGLRAPSSRRREDHDGDIGRANESPAGTGAPRTSFMIGGERGRPPRDWGAGLRRRRKLAKHDAVVFGDLLLRNGVDEFRDHPLGGLSASANRRPSSKRTSAAFTSS